MSTEDENSGDVQTWVTLPGGVFRIGSDAFYPEEGPAHDRQIEPFTIARAPVTNREFAEFVAATGHVTVAERELPAAVFPGLGPDERIPGSTAFTPTAGPVPLDDWMQWWRWVPGADWRHPLGPDSTVDGKDDHPVVHVAFEDANAFARWAGLRLPTEAEHEYAASGGVIAAPYAWGSERTPDGIVMANTWFGLFPYRNEGARGWVGTSPVGSFPPNAFGLVDMIGNVWEWTTDYYISSHATRASKARDPALPAGCTCGPDRTRLTRLAEQSIAPGESVPRRVLKGGSHLCAPEYCLRYRPPARSPEAEDTSTSHIGFRCVRPD
ncbi:MAG: formylglycine-generating enzyme family protein [Micrococcales bacterium]|nr:formylglycine-generating enzyme family protein [Micrococcales bacterium]